MNRERQLIEIDGDDYNYNEYNNYQHNQSDKHHDQDMQYYNNHNYNNMNNYYPKSTKASHLFNTEIYSLRMSDNY